MGEHQVVLVTGFPRMIARLVATEVLALGPQWHVRLLARGKFLEEAQHFIDSHPHKDRLTLIEGDAAAIDLGLSGAEFRALAQEVTYVQHHAQITWESADKDQAESLNIQGTREVLELCREAPHLHRLVHLSSTRVSGDRTGTVFENELEAGQQFRSVIEETLFRGERLVRRAMDKIPVTIVRPSYLVGHSVTGEIDRLDGFYLLVMLVLTAPADFTIPLPARGDAPMNLVPIDYIARASVRLMTEPSALRRTFHLVDPIPLPAKHVYEVIARAAGRKAPTGFIPANLARAVLSAPGLERFVKSPRAFLDQLCTPVTYSARGAREVLVPNGIDCPSFESYVDPLIAYVRDHMASRRTVRPDAVKPVSDVEDPLA